MELDDKTFRKIEILSEEGNRLVSKNRLNDALAKYREALELIPSEVDDCETSSWLQASIGDTLFMSENYNDAVENLLDALNCFEQVDNAFIYLRVGQCYFEMGNLERSKENLLKAYMLEGETIFEDEDEKYFDVIKSII
jgi:tetratricopeptide (TPR) repeat protein